MVSCYCIAAINGVLGRGRMEVNMPQKQESQTMERLRTLMRQAELLRGALGLSRYELAKRIGIDGATYGRAVRLITVPHTETVFALEDWVQTAKIEVMERLRSLNLVA